MAEPVKTLTNREIVKLCDGLRCLDGVSNEAQKIERYDFDENIGWDISKDRDKLEHAEVVYNKHKAALAARLGVVEKMRLTDENCAAVAQFVDQNETLLDKTQDITGLLKLSRKGLLKAGVKIPGIFTQLMPLLVD